MIIVGFSSKFRERVAEWHSALAMFSIGIILLMEGETFALAPYSEIQNIATESTWGTICAGLGGLRLAILGVNGAMWRSPHLRAVCAGLSALVWSNFLTGYLSSHTPTLMLGMVSAALLFDLYNSYRAAQDARQEDDKRGGSGHSG